MIQLKQYFVKRGNEDKEVTKEEYYYEVRAARIEIVDFNDIEKFEVGERKGYMTTTVIPMGAIRPGNSFWLDNVIVQLDGKSIMDIEYKISQVQRYKPVLLNDQWFDRMKFERNHEPKQKHKILSWRRTLRTGTVKGNALVLELEVLPDGSGYTLALEDTIANGNTKHWIRLREVQYVHEVQNAYLDFTGKELQP